MYKELSTLENYELDTLRDIVYNLGSDMVHVYWKYNEMSLDLFLVGKRVRELLDKVNDTKIKYAASHGFGTKYTGVPNEEFKFYSSNR